MENDEIVGILFSIILKKVKSGEEVFISGFGKFYPKQCQCCGHNIISFKPSVVMKEDLNSG